MSARGAAAAIGLSLFALAASARAEAPPAPVVNLVAAPIFGQDATSGTGWSEIVARIDNLSAAAQKGTVELSSAPTYGGSDKFNARAPFNVPAGKSAVVRLPIHGSQYYAPAITVTALGEKGQRLAGTNVTVNGAPAPLLVDIDQPSRLSVVMRSWPISTAWSPSGSPSYYGGPSTTTSPLNVGVPTFDRTTGDPVLPEHAAGYTAVTAVIVHSDVLAKLEAASLDALVNWVLAGGTLAVVPNRPEDLRGPVLTALVGGAIAVADVPAHLFRLPGAARPSSAPGMFPLDPSDPDDPTTPKAPPPVPMRWEPGAPVPLTPVKTPIVRSGPAPDVRGKLAGYAGGNLHPSDFGASAAYGLGEVHVLAFDPTTTPMLDDPWVHARIVDMVARAWDRRPLSAFPHGSGERNNYHIDEVRRALDPNENFRPGLGLSAILLVIYSIVAGPITFLRAAKKGRPLRPLLWAPLLSLGAFGAIVLVGLASKGWRGRARHLSLVETGAGVTRGTVRRYRGFFASETRSLSVLASDRTCVLDVATGDSSSHENAVLRLDRNGASLENLTSLPWQTVVVREDGFVDWKGGISVIANNDGSIEVINHTGRLLKDVLVWVPNDKVTYFAELKDGASVRSTAGKHALSSSSRRKTTSGTRFVHPLQAHDLGYAISAKYNDRVAQAWGPFESAAGDAVDWWPDEVPVVMGDMIVDGKLGSDSGLGLENDRVLFRVVGKGGAP